MFFASLDEPKQMKIIDGADHFFEGHLPELAEAVTKFIDSVTAE
jgi:alpha/beta superfamily hydrolase